MNLWYIWIRAVRDCETWQGWLCHATEPVLIDTPALYDDVRKPHLTLSPVDRPNLVAVIFDTIENLGYESHNDPLQRRSDVG
jgi:hypothetical protein